MAYRKDLCAAGLLLLLSLLQTTQSAPIVVPLNMKMAGKNALEYLRTSAVMALKNDTGSHSVGCITEPKEHERLNCTLISIFSSYLTTAPYLKGVDKKLSDSLRNIEQRVKDLSKIHRCEIKDTCEATLQDDQSQYTNLETVRSILQLYLQWIDKSTEDY